jgi:PIN domain nuclease of toxin-antitoxin system
MQFLLDTHTLLWFFSGNSQLSDFGRNLIEDINHQKLISIASAWEIAIKQSKNKLTLAIPLEDYLQQKIQLDDFELLTIQLNHLTLVSTLPFYHNDPFDRLLIAQAMTENIPILSKDSAFDAYRVKRIWDTE